MRKARFWGRASISAHRGGTGGARTGDDATRRGGIPLNLGHFARYPLGFATLAAADARREELPHGATPKTLRRYEACVGGSAPAVAIRRGYLEWVSLFGGDTSARPRRESLRHPLNHGTGSRDSPRCYCRSA
ncbi:hypothetical protein LBMAG42_12830 [Deltaproteobacteria bacterium]|nr:hypothetical protein LBMAG42_12830 [Deltaproteobacteria bacterium]